jgi:hypothetical protein
MTLSQKQQIFSKMLGEFLRWIYLQEGYGVTFGEVQRPEEMQEIYFKSGKSKTKDSKHLLKLAADLNLFIKDVYVTDNNKYRCLGQKWEELGKSYVVEARWGGRFGLKPEEYSTKIGWDANHFEISN